MASPAFVGIDWGTSNGRMVLVDAQGMAVAETTVPGISALGSADEIEAACFAGLESWTARHGPLPVIMAGMVGSNIGWRLAPYVACPATAGDVFAAAQKFRVRDVDFLLLPGVAATRASGLPEVMRGEETQIIGALGAGSGLFCLPGTHAKWVQVDGASLLGFHTALTGELMDILGRHSILLAPRRSVNANVGPAFDEGVAAARQSALGLESLLFTVRSRQIAGSLIPADADSFLAGLCIGADVRSAMALHGPQPAVTLVGTAALTSLYAAALGQFDISAMQISGRDAALAGLHQAYVQWFCINQVAR